MIFISYILPYYRIKTLNLVRSSLTVFVIYASEAKWTKSTHDSVRRRRTSRAVSGTVIRLLSRRCCCVNEFEEYQIDEVSQLIFASFGLRFYEQGLFTS